jgi:cell division protein FtsB
MITESITIQGLHVISLALTPIEQWEATRGSFISTSFADETWLTVLAVVALIISVALLFWIFAKYRHSEHRLNLKITELTIANVKLRQENAELTTTNEKLRQENAELYRKQVEVLENIINAETPSK